MKLVLTFTRDELGVILKKALAPDLFPEGLEIVNLEALGYPIREFELTIGKEEKPE